MNTMLSPLTIPSSFKEVGGGWEMRSKKDQGSLLVVSLSQGRLSFPDADPSCQKYKARL